MNFPRPFCRYLPAEWVSKRFAQLLLLCAVVLAPICNAQSQGEGSSTYRYKLANGMELIVLPDHRAAPVVHMVWVRVGSIDEVDGTSGVAHAIEHMMFKGTP